MIEAKQSFAREIVFDDVTGIPSLIPGEILNPEKLFSFEESDKKTISSQPLLQGNSMSFKIFKLHHLRSILSTFANILSPKKYEAKTKLENRVARSKKNKKAKFCHKLFQKRPNPEK